MSHPASPAAHPSAHSTAENDPSSYAPCGGLSTPTLHAAGMLRFHLTCGADRIAGSQLPCESAPPKREAPLPETARVLCGHASAQRWSARSWIALCDLQRSLGANFSWLPSLASSLPSRRGLYSNRPNWQAEPPRSLVSATGPGLRPISPRLSALRSGCQSSSRCLAPTNTSRVFHRDRSD